MKTKQPTTSTSDDAIIELHGYLVQDIRNKINLWEQDIVQRRGGESGFFARLFSGVLLSFVALAGFFAFVPQYFANLRPFLGFKEEVVLQFYRDHIGFGIETTWFSATRGRRHEVLAWRDIARIQGRKTRLLLFFQRRYLFILGRAEASHGGAASRIVDLGPMPEEAFRQLIQQLNALTQASVVRQQIDFVPYRFRATGLNSPMFVVTGLLLITIVGGGAVFLFGPQLLSLLRIDFAKGSGTAQQNVPEGSEPTQKYASGFAEGEADLAELVRLEIRYRERLATDPGNAEAMQGLARVAEQYVDLAKKASSNKLWDKASEYVAKAKQIRTDLARMGFAWERMERVVKPSGGFVASNPAPTVPANVAVDKRGGSYQQSEERSQQPPETVKKSARTGIMTGGLVNNGNGTITDTRTGLVGLQGTCFGSESWEQAVVAVAYLANGFCGLTDGSLAGTWRLPAKAELSVLGEWEKSGLFGVVPGRSYWSNTTLADDPSRAWFMDLKSGQTGQDDRRNGRHDLWPVR